jgi:hypothetical protein
MRFVGRARCSGGGPPPTGMSNVVREVSKCSSCAYETAMMGLWGPGHDARCNIKADVDVDVYAMKDLTRIIQAAPGIY